MAADAMRLAKRLDEVGFSDIVQVRNKVMELRADRPNGARFPWR